MVAGKKGNPVNQADPFGLCPQGMTGRDWAHLILGIVGCIPYVGIVANVVNAVLYFQEGDALSGILCIAGAAIGVGGIMAAASGAACAVKTVGLALKTAGTAYVATTMVREIVENAEITLDLLYENGGELNGEVLMSAAQTVLCGVGAVAGFAEVGKCISTASALSASGMACFVAGTQVLTIDGMKNIEDVEVGDYVYSTNEETGESDYKEVLQVFEKETEVITHVFYEIQSADGESTETSEDGQKTETKEIETTLNHPFWCEGEWRAAGTLEAGDLLTLADGTQVEITDVTFEDRPTTVYNMEVADYHTYYVGEDSVWVHNKCGTSGGASTSGETGSGGGTLRDSRNIRYSQDSIKGTFEDGTSVNELKYHLQSAPEYALDVEPIRIVKYNDLPKDLQVYLSEQGVSSNTVFSLDNRRLYAAKQAGVRINTIWATQEDLNSINLLKRFTTTTGGKTITVR